MISSLLPLIQGGGVVGMSLVAAYLMVTDRLMGRRSVDRMLEGYRSRIDYMETSSVEHMATINALVAQNAKLQLQGELAVALLNSLQSINVSGIAEARDRHVASTD